MEEIGDRDVRRQPLVPSRIPIERISDLACATKVAVQSQPKLAEAVFRSRVKLKIELEHPSLLEDADAANPGFASQIRKISLQPLDRYVCHFPANVIIKETAPDCCFILRLVNQVESGDANTLQSHKSERL